MAPTFGSPFDLYSLYFLPNDTEEEANDEKIEIPLVSCK